MKNTLTKNLTRVVLLPMLILVVTACGVISGSLSGEAARNISGKATNYNGTRTFVEAKAGNSKIGSGVIDNDGTFNLQLEESISDTLLESFFGSIPKLCPDVKVSAPETKSLTLGAISVAGSTSTLTQINWDSSDEKSRPETIIQGARIYADRDLSVTGTCNANLGTGGAPYPTEFSLNLKKGWNIATITAQGTATAIIKASFRSETPTEVNWYYTVQ
jgi:hypothetical protein